MREAVTANTVRHDWTKEEIAAIYYQPVLELAYQAVSTFFLFLFVSLAVIITKS